ncbi:MAG: M48 family metallopeptidase [Flavobacteriales bacterium]
MRKRWVLLTVIAVAAGCAKVPITGRSQMNLLPESQMMGMSLTAYEDFLKEHPGLPAADQRVHMVKRIGDKLAAAATKYCGDNGASDRVAGFKWEFNVVEDATVNAWCMPGGKVVVYTGILPVTQDEAGLAVVMGHEIAHAIARHGNERMSQGMIVQLGGIALTVALQEKTQLTQDLFLQSYGIGSQLGMLAYSRNHESEADKMGLIFMAMSGYDPRTAPKFWERMSANGGAAPPEWLSTHPSDATRVRDLEAYMPKALEYYKP